MDIHPRRGTDARVSVTLSLSRYLAARGPGRWLFSLTEPKHITNCRALQANETQYRGLIEKRSIGLLMISS